MSQTHAPFDRTPTHTNIFAYVWMLGDGDGDHDDDDDFLKRFPCCCSNRNVMLRSQRKSFGPVSVSVSTMIPRRADG